MNTQRQQPEIDKTQFSISGFSGQIRPLQEEWYLYDVDSMWMHAGANRSSACTENAGVALYGRRCLINFTCTGCAGSLSSTDSHSGKLMAIGNPYGPSQQHSQQPACSTSATARRIGHAAAPQSQILLWSVSARCCNE
jgi:hypothetical protein